MYPALAVLQALEGNYSEILWVGGEGGMEADLINRLNLPYDEIPAAGVHGIGLRSLPGNIYKLIRGTFKSIKIIRQFQPDVIFYTGGYVAAPMALAGSSKQSVLFVPDIEPGLALKFIARFADAIALTTETSKQFFNPSKQLVVTGYPLRKEIKQLPKSEAKKVFNLHDKLPVIMVFGGSKGARSINQAIQKNLSTLLTKAQIIHVTGNLDWPTTQDAYAKLPPDMASDYHIFPYLHEEISAAFASADLCICRAGASTLGELPFFGLPAILVPYPYAWRYQKVNAQFLVDHNAAILLPDEEMDNQLITTITNLLDDSQKLTQMRASMHALSKPEAAEKIGKLIMHQHNITNLKGGQS